MLLEAMAEFIHATQERIKGPFLIDRSQIEALNRILEEEWLRFTTERKRIVDQAVEDQFKELRPKSYYKNESDDQMRKRIREQVEDSSVNKQRKECFVFFRNGSVAKVPDFAKALCEPDLQDKEPNGLYAVLESGARSCELTLTTQPTTLTVEVAPKRDQFVQQTLMVLKNWQNSVRPPKWQRIWFQLDGLQWFLWLGAVVFSLIFIQHRAESEAVRKLGQEAMQLLATNLSVQQQGKAIQLLLAKTYGYAPAPVKREYPSWFLFIITVGLAYCIALSFVPNVAIGIGNGEKKVRNWRWYSTLILISIPAFVFTTFMWPKLEHFLISMF